jgi:hypothetical protein
MVPTKINKTLSKQFSGKIKRQFEISTKFYVIQFHRVSTKKFTIATINVSQKLLVDH